MNSHRLTLHLVVLAVFAFIFVCPQITFAGLLFDDIPGPPDFDPGGDATGGDTTGGTGGGSTGGGSGGGATGGSGGGATGGGTTGGGGGGGGTGGGSGQADFGYFETLSSETASVVSILLVLVVSIALLVFFWGLAIFILKAGDESERQKGRNIMFWGIVALAVIVSVWGLVEILQSLFGVDDSPASLQTPSVEGL